MSDQSELLPVSPEAQSAWVGYEPIFQFGEITSCARFNTVMRHAFLAGYIAAKRDTIARHRLSVGEVERLRQALEDVTNPLGYLRRKAEAEGRRLGGMAHQIAHDVYFVQKIAQEALDAAALSDPHRLSESGRDLEAEAWAWIEKTYGTESDDPVDRAYAADEMVDAFHAGAGHRLSVGEADEAMRYVRAAGAILAQRSADPPGTPTRDALVMVNAAIHPQARPVVGDPDVFAKQHLAALSPTDRPDGEVSAAANDVIAERRRQVEAEGWTPEHDDHHDGDLALPRAAACYALAGTGSNGPFWITHLQVPQQVWPYQWEWKPKDRRSNLVRAGALILAEIERIDRAALSSAREG